MIDRFLRLRHDSVVCRDDEDHDVGDLGATSAHQSERRVTRRVQEDDVAVANFDVVGADVLRDAAGFALGNLGFTDRVEERGLAVVDVPHDRDDRRSRHHVFGTRFIALGGDDFLLEAPHFDFGSEFARRHRGGVGVERRVDGDAHALHEQLAEHVLHANVELVGQVLDRHALCQGDGAADRRRRRRRGRHTRR